MIWVCKEHGINKSLEVTGLVPFNLLVDMVVNEDIKHVATDWQLDLFKDIRQKTLFVV